jgi:TonB-dependent SusC/RagA subfamily outer membrane receptor
MLKEKSNAWARLKYLYVLPLAAISVAAFAHPEISSSLEQVSAAKVSDLFVKDQAPTDSTAFPLVIIDDKEVTWEEFQELQVFPQDKIYKISILKGKQATDACGEKGKNGVIFVTTMEKVASGAGDTCTPPASFIRLTSHDSTAFPLVIIDGKEVTRDEFKASSQDQFHSVTILKDNAATGTYGEKGKNGVIVISTTPPPPLSILPDSVIKKDNGFDIRLASHDSTALPLVIIDDKEVTLDELQALSEDKIHSFHILKDHAATKMYGKKGKNGVIIITTMEKASHTNTPPPPLADTILLEQTKKVEARSQKVVPVKVMKKDSSIMTVGNATKTNTK